MGFKRVCVARITPKYRELNHSLLSKTNCFLDGNRELVLQRLVRLVWREVKSIKAIIYVSIKKDFPNG